MLTASNTNSMMWRAYDYIHTHGIKEDSRNGPVLTVPHPILLCYTNPEEKVNFCPIRDANPFLHFFEPLWMLEARGDVEFIARFVPRMADYSDDGEHFNAHYGYNIRYRFEVDQLHGVIAKLQRDPLTRQAVVQIWNPDDLLAETKDRACNTQLVFRMVDDKLDMTVFNRSNDAVWGGVSGANITNLFVFQEYVASNLECEIGAMFVCSNNLHMYLDNPQTQELLNKYAGLDPTELSMFNYNPYQSEEVTPYPLIHNWASFDWELSCFMENVRNGPALKVEYENKIFSRVAQPMYNAFVAHKNGHKQDALDIATTITASDWRLATVNWLKRRYDK